MRETGKHAGGGRETTMQFHGALRSAMQLECPQTWIIFRCVQYTVQPRLSVLQLSEHLYYLNTSSRSMHKFMYSWIMNINNLIIRITYTCSRVHWLKSLQHTFICMVHVSNNRSYNVNGVYTVYAGKRKQEVLTLDSKWEIFERLVKGRR